MWKVIYGAWDYIKNSGNFPEAENLTLEWVGSIPGKRESRRFEGDYMMSQKDIVEQREHQDAVAYGGWSIDLHPADGVFSEKPGCNQWHAKGIYQIPYRCLYSKNIQNLFLGGRLISASHVAFASTRVMATSAYIGQAIGMAAYIAKTNCSGQDSFLLPHEIYSKGLIARLQKELLRSGQYIPKLKLIDELDLVPKANLSVSSEYALEELEAHFPLELKPAVAQMLPLKKGKVPVLRVQVEGLKKTSLEVELRISSKTGNFTPDLTLEALSFQVNEGQQHIEINFSSLIPEESYAFITFLENPDILIYRTNNRITGLLSTFNLVNKAVSNFGKQTPPEEIGMDTFEFWCPERRPKGHNLALKVSPSIQAFGVQELLNGVYRPTTSPNAWVSSLADENPEITLNWTAKEKIAQIDLFFDTDFDHPMESVLMGHPEDIMPFCVQNYSILDDNNKVIYACNGNYQSMNSIILNEPITTQSLKIRLEHPNKDIPASLMGLRCYGGVR